MNYSKLKNDLERYSSQINDYTVTDYKERRYEIHNAINQAETLEKQIKFQCNELDSSNSLSSNDQDKVKKAKNEIDTKMSNLAPKIKEAIENILNVERTKFSNVSPEEDSAPIQVEGRPRDASLSQDLKVLNLQNNEEMMKQRRKDLEDIKQASHQIKDLTNVMKTTAQEQGENLNSIENHIMEVQDNVEKANKEMVKANELNKKNRTKVIWLLAIVIFVCIVIAILILIFTGVFNK